MTCLVVPNARNARLMQTRHIRPYRRSGGGGPGPGPFDPEDGLTLTTSVAVGALLDLGDTGSTTAPYVFAMDFTGLNGGTGVGGGIMECGGTTTGMYVGFYTDGSFLVRCCIGVEGLAAPNTSFAAFSPPAAPSGDGTLVIALDRDVATESGFLVKVWWNGTQLTPTLSNRGTTNQLWGPDDGSYLGTPTIVRGNNMAGQPSLPANTVPYTTASSLRIYENQRVATP